MAGNEEKVRLYTALGFLIIGGALTIYLLTRKPTPEVSGRLPTSAERIVEDVIRKPAIEEQLKQIAMRQLNLPDSEIVVRSLRAEDLGLATPSFSFPIATANAWNNIISTTIADNRFIAITGVVYTGNIITQVRIVAAGATKEIWNIQAIPAMETPRYVDLTPTAIQQNQGLSIDVYAINTSAGESLVIEGIVVERRGLVVA